MNATLVQGCPEMFDYTPAADVAAGAILHHNGNVAIVHADIAAGRLGAVAIPDGDEVYRVPKAASIVILDGGRVYWTPSAATASFKQVNAAAFYLGTAVGDSASSDTTLLVRPNHRAEYALDVNRDPCDSTLVLTAGTPSLTRKGGTNVLAFSATAEAQKIDLITKDGVSPSGGFIVEGQVEIATNGDAAAVDFNIGVANGTHASDADAITESCFIHVDGASTNLNAESDDGTTEVNATDTTVDFTAGTRFEFWMDARDPADIQIYLDGVLVLSATTFKLNAATGPLFLLAHLEKTADDSPGEFHVDRLALRLAL